MYLSRLSLRVSSVFLRSVSSASNSAIRRRKSSTSLRSYFFVLSLSPNFCASLTGYRHLLSNLDGRNRSSFHFITMINILSQVVNPLKPGFFALVLRVVGNPNEE